MTRKELIAAARRERRLMDEAAAEHRKALEMLAAIDCPYTVGQRFRLKGRKRMSLIEITEIAPSWFDGGEDNDPTPENTWRVRYLKVRRDGKLENADPHDLWREDALEPVAE